MTEFQDSGLSWLSLVEIENIDDILAALAKFTIAAKFERDEKGLEYCTAEEDILDVRVSKQGSLPLALLLMIMKADGRAG